MLNRLALRLATVRALRGRTLAGSNVLDSDIGPIDELASEQPTPFIVVYTDDGAFHHGDRNLWQLAGDNRVESGTQQLVIEIAITQRMKLVDDDGEPYEGAVPLETNPGLAFNVDLMERQIYAALMDPAPAAVWAAVWRHFVLAIDDHRTVLGTSKRDGVRFAGRQITLAVKLPDETRPGDSIEGPRWSAFFAAAETDEDLTVAAAAIRAALEGVDVAPDLVLAGAYGLTNAEARALAVQPPAGVDSAEGVPVFDELGQVDEVP